MNDAIEFPSLGLESFHYEMGQQADKFKAICALNTKLRISRGVNQTLAMECEGLSGEFINTNNPLGAFSVQPSKTNYSITLEELSHLHIAAIGGLVALVLALVWKIIKWFKKWRGGGDESSGSSDSGEGGSSSSGYMSPSRANAVITGSVDVLNSIDTMKVELVSACLKGGAVSRTDITSQLETIRTNAYTKIAEKTTGLFDDFINNAGTVAFLIKLHEGALKEAPTKMRDAFNKLEQIINDYSKANDSGARDAEVDKLKLMLADSEDTKSFWYNGEIPDTKTCAELTATIKQSITERRAVFSTLGKEMAAKTSNFTDKLRQGLHGTYEKLDADTARLMVEVETDLQSKLTSLSKQIKGDVSRLSGESDDTGFAKAATDIVHKLGADVASIGNLTQASSLVCKDYAGVIGTLAHANKLIINDFIAVAKKNNANDMRTELNKLKIANDKLLKNR
jgi:hypothetical protein